MGTENIDWKTTGVGAAQVVLGVAKAAVGVTGGPAAATGVDGAVGGLDKLLGGVGVNDVRLSQTPAQTPAQAPATPSPAQTVAMQPTPPPPVAVPPTPPTPVAMVPPQMELSRLERFERDGRPLPSPAPPPSPTAEELERTKLLRTLVSRGWSDDEARILEAGRSTDSLKLIGPIAADSEVRASAQPIEKVTGQLVKEAPGRVRITGSSPPWLLVFSRYWMLSAAERAALASSLLAGIADDDLSLRTAMEVLPDEVTLARVGSVPLVELQRDISRLSTDQLWLLRAAVAGSKQTGGK